MKEEKLTGKLTTKSPKKMPWWASVLLAIGSYYLLKYLLPGLHPEHAGLQKLFQLAPNLAPPAAILFLLLAAKQLYDVDIHRNKETNDKNEEESAE